MMPLVEVIRASSRRTRRWRHGQAVAEMGKTPVVVNDCPGFFVNRVLFPYFAGFHLLLRDGADFMAVDKAMEKFGWRWAGVPDGRRRHGYRGARRGRHGRGFPTE